MRKNIVLTALTCIMTVYFSYGQMQDQFIIKGTMDTIPHAQYFLYYRNKGEVIRDTISIDENCNFEYSGILMEPTIFSIQVKNTFNPRVIGDQSIYSFWIEPGKTMHFEGKKGWLVKDKHGLSVRSTLYHLKNSEIDSVAIKYRKAYQNAFEQREIETHSKLSDRDRSRIYDSVFNSFVSQNSSHYFRLYLLSNLAVTGRESDSTIISMIKDLPENLKNTYLAKYTLEVVEKRSKLSVDKIIPDFQQSDTLGHLIKLSSYRGKYVLIDFWASWCYPCRQEHPYLVQEYKKYEEKGLEIISISLDEERESWLKAIKDDGLTWVQLSDLKGFKNEVAKRFYIRSIPDNFLIDPNGVILARNLRGKALAKKLDEVFIITNKNGAIKK